MVDLEQMYSPSSVIGGSWMRYLDRYRADSDRVRAGLHARTIAGGTVVVEQSPGAPMVAFVHGGYWQELSAAESLFPAIELAAAGWSFAAVEYTIAPAGTVDRMVAEVRAAVDRLATTTDRLVLVGHSAGAQLAAMTSVVRRAAVERTILVSGVYDLEPLTHTTINDPLGLDAAAVARLSPLVLDVAAGAEVTVLWGEVETSAFAEQGRAYAEHVRAAGRAVTAAEVPGRNHFDILFDLAGWLGPAHP